MKLVIFQELISNSRRPQRNMPAQTIERRQTPDRRKGNSNQIVIQQQAVTLSVINNANTLPFNARGYENFYHFFFLCFLFPPLPPVLCAPPSLPVHKTHKKGSWVLVRSLEQAWGWAAGESDPDTALMTSYLSWMPVVVVVVVVVWFESREVGATTPPPPPFRGMMTSGHPPPSFPPRQPVLSV